jgi:hypothetical protein
MGEAKEMATTNICSEHNENCASDGAEAYSPYWFWSSGERKNTATLIKGYVRLFLRFKNIYVLSSLIGSLLKCWHAKIWAKSIHFGTRLVKGQKSSSRKVLFETC